MITSAIKNTILPILLICSFLANAQIVREPQHTPAEWSAAYPPFRIAGNLYYVGTKDLACYLFVGKQGHILINTGLANSASLIKAAVEKLGFKFSDIKILLTTQAHYDHMGAMNAVQRETGARFLVSDPDAQVVRDGGRSDYALGSDTASYAPVKIAGLLKNNALIQLGEIKLRMLLHPGHTKGSCSYIADVADGKKNYRVLIANMPTIVTEKPFTKISAYPTIAADYAATLKAMKNLHFDFWFSSHASQFSLEAKHKPGQPYNPEAFRDKAGYNKALNELQKEYDEKISREQ
ncbi:MAG: subclass B3 metallo-beta-lactamase [Sphingobacteriaceae bacterium]|nr:MAG: subclass B3 metallo-beta-lactamase [Sphingobacteriaceae bacterium]